jgi:hypothetical protein
MGRDWGFQPRGPRTPSYSVIFDHQPDKDAHLNVALIRSQIMNPLKLGMIQGVDITPRNWSVKSGNPRNWMIYGYLIRQE